MLGPRHVPRDDRDHTQPGRPGWAHLDAWRQYWKRVGSDTRTGIWHETFLVRAGEYEAIYGNMPVRGLGKAGRTVRVADATGARQRFRAAARG